MGRFGNQHLLPRFLLAQILQPGLEELEEGHWIGSTLR
jgi:hypothetical protein